MVWCLMVYSRLMPSAQVEAGFSAEGLGLRAEGGVLGLVVRYLMGHCRRRG
jgi:hypothetical protein